MTAASGPSRAQLRSYRLKSYRDAFDALPPEIKYLAGRKWALFQRNPADRALSRHPLKGTPHAALGREEVYIGIHYRAVFRRGQRPGDGAEVYVWEWIGSKEHFTTKYRP